MTGRQENPVLETAIRELEQPLHRYLERYVGHRSVAEDLLQETLIRMSKGFSSFAGRSSIKTWAYSIANRVAADYFRHPDRKKKIIELDEGEEPLAPDRPVDEGLIAGEMNDCIRGVIDSLPETYRAALILRDIEGLTVAQTAEISECSVATAKIRIHRARSRLKKALEDQCEFFHDPDDIFRCDRKP